MTDLGSLPLNNRKYSPSILAILILYIAAFLQHSHLAWAEWTYVDEATTTITNHINSSRDENLKNLRSQQRIVKAYCDAAGAHVLYGRGKKVIHMMTKKGKTCEDMRISDDDQSAGWLVTSEVDMKDDKGKIIQSWQGSHLFVNGNEIDFHEAALYGWGFYNGGRQVVFEAGPLHGGGNKFLYDLSKNKVIDECDSRSGATCPDWAQAL